MRAIEYTQTGEPTVLHVVERGMPQPGPGEVRVRVHVSAVNPTDWKARRGSGPGQALAFSAVVPHQDGAGVVDAVGPDVEGLRTGDRVWLWEAAWQRSDGTAAEYVVLPAEQAVVLADDVSFDVGASLGIPALTAHRCLTVHDGGSDRLAPGALAGSAVLVAGGAGVVGHAAIQLARWAGATVVCTVSSPDKDRLALAAGAHHVVNYRTDDAAASIRALVPEGVDVVVEVSPAANADLNAAVTAVNACIAVYADTGGELVLPVRPNMTANTRYQFVLVYRVPPAAKRRAVEDVSAAASAGVLSVGAEHGLPLHRYGLEDTAAAHAAVEAGVVGRVLIDI